jgi:hypothetical protein
MIIVGKIPGYEKKQDLSCKIYVSRDDRESCDLGQIPPWSKMILSPSDEMQISQYPPAEKPAFRPRAQNPCYVYAYVVVLTKRKT